MIETFVSRPNWAPGVIEHKLKAFYELLDDVGFKPNTIGKSHAPLMSPFEDVRRLMQKCSCTIVLGLPQIFIHSGKIKEQPILGSLYLSTEWNQIETTMSLMLKLSTLVLLHNKVAARGVFERGAANLFVYEFDSLNDNWLSDLRPSLNALKEQIEGR